MRNTYYLSRLETVKIVVLGKVGKTMFRNLVKTIFGQSIVNHSLHHFTKLEEVKELVETENQTSYIISVFPYSQEDAEVFAKLISPTIVVVTNIGDGHLIYDSDKIPYKKIYQSFNAKCPEDTIFLLNKDDDTVSDLEENLRKDQVIKFGLNNNADFYASNITQEGPLGINFLLNNEIKVQLPIYQFYQVYNILSAIVLARLFNYELDFILEEMKKNLSIPKGRGNLVIFKDIYVLNDTKTNNMQSIINAAQTLVSFKSHSNRMIMVIDEADLDSGDPINTHVNIGHFLSALPIDIIITVGKYAKQIAQGLLVIPNKNRVVIETLDAEEAVMNLIILLERNDCILLKSNKESSLNEFVKILERKLN
jgi:UDP-N-acetylmuramoyl-tripeptide--D-alanyl-D-alanine ligase